MFNWDPELADASYFEHYNNTNNTMILISPLIPMRPDTFKMASNSPTRTITWHFYRPGLLKEFYQAGGHLELFFTWQW